MDYFFKNDINLFKTKLFIGKEFSIFELKNNIFSVNHAFDHISKVPTIFGALCINVVGFDMIPGFWFHYRQKNASAGVMLDIDFIKGDSFNLKSKIH